MQGKENNEKALIVVFDWLAEELRGLPEYTRMPILHRLLDRSGSDHMPPFKDGESWDEYLTEQFTRAKAKVLVEALI